MSRKMTTSSGVLLVAAVTAVLLVMTVAAHASPAARAEVAQNLVFQKIGPVTAGAPGCLLADLQSTDGKKIGQQMFCPNPATPGPAGDLISTGDTTFALKAGDLTATFVRHLRVISPFTSGPLALPDELVDPGNTWLAFVTDLTITGGTNSYKNATGSIREMGFAVINSGRPIWVNATDVADVR